jgi:serine/threonine protein kinase
MLDHDAFLMEYVDGSYIPRRDVRTGRITLTDEPFDRCLKLLDAIHERGVYHLDLRTRKNVVFDAGLRPHLIDFASAVTLPRGLARSPVGRMLAMFDRAGILKMKRLLARQCLRDTEARFLDRFELWRTIFWPPAAVVRWWRGRRRAQRGSSETGVKQGKGRKGGGGKENHKRGGARDRDDGSRVS